MENQSFEKNHLAETPPENTAAEAGMEKIEITLNEIEDLVRSQLDNKAKIKNLKITAVTEGLELTAELDAGMLGGKIQIQGIIVNTEGNVVIKDVSIDARGYVKSRIEENLSKFGPALKKYFEKRYGRPVYSICIKESRLQIELLKKIPKETTDLQTEKVLTNKTGAGTEEHKRRRELDSIIEGLKAEKSLFHRNYYMVQEVRDLIKKRRFEEAREVVLKVMAEGESKTQGLASIERQRKEASNP